MASKFSKDLIDKGLVGLNQSRARVIFLTTRHASPHYDALYLLMRHASPWCFFKKFPPVIDVLSHASSFFTRVMKKDFRVLNCQLLNVF